MTPETITNLIIVVVIPFIVGLLKKVNLPTKYAPVAAFVVACVLVGIGKLIGLEMNVNDLSQLILTGLATAGVAVLGYDQVKKLTEPK